MKSYTETSQRVATSEMYEQLTFQDQMFGSLAHPVKTSQSQDLEKDWGGYEVAMIGDAINLAFPDSKTRRGRVGKEVAQTLDRSCNQGVFIQNGEEYVIRKLTPKECMRLQGVPDEYTDKLIQAGISDSQIYKAAGDGLSVPIAKEIGERIRKTYEENY